MTIEKKEDSEVKTMFETVNQSVGKTRRWPCLFCDEWSWDVLS
ncbi:hypothetical protein RV11_GL003159 [Enterococcus phoeniculicola]|nr:hypothetical protein RV11_GL003159 [Enterococcus phoeniculicola]